MQTNREWIERTLRHEETPAVPFNFMFSPTALARAEHHYGVNVPDAIGLPIRMTSPKSIKPLYADTRKYGETITDEYGVVWSTSLIDRGSPIGPCLRESTLTGYQFPNADREYRFEHIGEWCRKQEGHFRVIWVGDLWERATFMRGMEDILMDVALDPAFVESLLRRISEFIQHTMRILFERFEFEGIAVSDDYGTQRGMVMSPTDWRRLIKPCLADIYGLAKKNRRIIFHHSCGNFVPVIGDLIDLGLDILHPIQPEAMDGAMLKREFGHRLTFCGGISTQGLLVRGTPAQVREEVRRLKRVMAVGGGYILEPGITIQDDVPTDNLIAMIDEARAPRP